MAELNTATRITWIGLLICSWAVLKSRAIAYHDFLVRRVGDLYEVDLHLQVDPEIPVETGHAVSRAVKRSMREKHPVVSKVLVHVEPANREHIMNRGLSGSGDADIKISYHWEI